jgi:hypothetical protein
MTFHKGLHTRRTVGILQVDPKEKAPICGAFAEPSNGLEPLTPYGENAGGVRLRVGPRASGRAGGPTGRVVVWGG